jgi:hypothetical protein
VTIQLLVWGWKGNLIEKKILKWVVVRFCEGSQNLTTTHFKIFFQPNSLSKLHRNQGFVRCGHPWDDFGLISG